jgi:hypothetical protein
MAIKPFEIQGSTLTIGGVDLQAGNTSVVIPGVTQATSYRVEEVEDTGDQTRSFGQVAPIIIDYQIFLDYLNNGSSSGRAVYSVNELDSEGFIDGISVDAPGSYTANERSAAVGNDLHAYIGTAVGDEFNPFVPTDWDIIPFRPKMRAGEIETIGGGGGSGLVQRTVNYPTGENGDTAGTMVLDPQGNVYVCIADYVQGEVVEGDTDIETSEPYNIGQTGGALLVWTTNIADYSDISALFTTDGWDGSSTFDHSSPGSFTIVSEAFQDYPTAHTCTRVGTNGSGSLFFNVNYTSGDASDIAQSSTATVAWSITPTQANIWEQLSTGSSGGNQLLNGGESFALMSEGDVVFDGVGNGGVNRGLVWNYGVNQGDGTNSMVRQDMSGLTVHAYTEGNGGGSTGNSNDGYSAPVRITTNQDANGKVWTFDGAGNLTFPDGSVQTTAYTGQSGSGVTTTYYVMANVDGTVLTSTDGVTWSTPVDITNNGINHVATNGTNIVYIDGSTVGYTSFATPATATETSISVDGLSDINTQQIIYGGGYFVIAGSGNNGTFRVPVYGYSTDGVNWTFKTITDSALQLVFSNSNSEDCDFNDVDYNGVGFNFAVNGTNVGGGVYTTNITETFTTTNYFSMVPGIQVAWNGNAWFYYNSSQGSGTTSSVDPRGASWDGPLDPWGTRVVDLGYTSNPDISDTMSGGDGVLAMSDGEGHVAYSTNNGYTWTIITPIPYNNSISDIVRGTTTTISWSGTSHGFSNGEKIVISGVTSFDAGEPGTSNQSYNGTFYIKDNGGTPELYTDQGLTTPWDTSTYWPPGTGPGSMTGTITFSHGTYIDAMDYANGYFYIGNDDEQVARASTSDMTTWTILDDQNNAFEYWNDFYGYTAVGASIVLSELVGDGAVASTGYKTTVYTDWNGYQGGEAGSDWFPYTEQIAVGDTLTFRNGEVRTVTDVNQSPGGHTAVVWNGTVDGSDTNPRYPIVITSSVYVEAVKNTARIKPDTDAATDFDQYMDIYAGQVPVVNTPIDSKHIHMAGHTGEVELFLGTDNNYVSVKEAGTTSASVNLHSENDVSVVDSNLRLNRKGSSWASVYGDGENHNLHNQTYDVSWATITVDDQGDYYVGGESNSYSEAIVSKISRDGELLWSKYVNGDNTAGWQLDGVAYYNNEVASLVQTQYDRNHNYYKLTVHDSESGDVKSTIDIYDTEGNIEARHMIHHSTLGWVVVGRNYGESSNTMSISSIGATGTGIIELPGSQAQINGQYPDWQSGSWSMSGTNITGVQTLQLGVGLYQAVPLTTVTGIGSGATISLIADYNYGNYGYDVITNVGQDYQTDDEVKALGSLLGGVDGGSSIMASYGAVTPGAQIKIYFDKTTYPDLYNQLTNASYQAVYDTNYYNIVGVLSQGANWEVTLDTSVIPSGSPITFYTQHGNDAYFTIYGNGGAFDGIKYALNGQASKATVRIDMGRAMGYGSTDFTGGSFTLGKTINAQPFVWTSSGLKKYLPSPQTNGWGYAQCVAEDTYDGGLVVGGYIDNSSGNAFVWKLLADGTTSWANTINTDGSAINHVAVSAVNGDIFASNGATSINKFNSSGSFIDRYETNGPYGFNAHVYLAVEDGTEYLYAGGQGGSMWTNGGALFVSKLTTDFKVVWGRSLEDNSQGINGNYDFNHVNFALGKGQASLVGYSHLNGLNYYNGVILTLSTKDDFETRSIGRWNLVQSGYMSWSNNNASNYSAYDLINVGGVSPTTSSMLSELETSQLSWTNYTFQYKLIDLNPTKQGIRGVEAIEFADGGVLEHNPAIIPPSVHFDSNYSWNYTLQLSDIGRFIINQTIPNDSYCQDLYITVPQNDVVPFPVGTVITLINTHDVNNNGYRIYVQPENYGNNESPKIWATGGNQNPSTWSFQGMQTATLMKISTNGWLLTANDITNED